MTDHPLTRSSLIPADLPDMMYYVLFLIRRFDGGKLLLYVFRWRYEKLYGEKIYEVRVRFLEWIIVIFSFSQLSNFGPTTTRQQQYVSYIHKIHLIFMHVCYLIIILTRPNSDGETRFQQSLPDCHEASANTDRPAARTRRTTTTIIMLLFTVGRSTVFG